jgi:hypothetical protein
MYIIPVFASAGYIFFGDIDQLKKEHIHAGSHQSTKSPGCHPVI